jgi:hypothetical protein
MYHHNSIRPYLMGIRRKEMAKIVIERDVYDMLTMSVEDGSFDEVVGWEVSNELKAQLEKELKDHLGGEFAKDFDPAIQAAIQMLG